MRSAIPRATRLFTVLSAVALPAQSVAQATATHGQDENRHAEEFRLPESPSPRAVFVLSPNPDAGMLPKMRMQLEVGHAYTLPELIDIAERENPETRIAWEAARNAAIGKGMAESTYLPTITAHVLGGYQGASGQNGSSGFTVKNSGNVFGSIEAVSLNWLLFDFGGRRNIAHAAGKLADAASIGFTASHQQTIYAVAMAYYSYVAATERHRTAADSLTNAQDVEAAAKARYSAGEGTVLETAQTRNLTAQAELTVVNAIGGEEQAYAALLAAMGISPLATVRIAPLEHRPLSEDDAIRVDSMLQDALSRRPDVLAAYSTLKASNASVGAAEAQNRPKMFLSATGAYVNGELGITAVPPIGGQLPTLNITGNQWNGTVLVGVSIPIFDSHRRSDAIRQARNEEDRASATLDRVRLHALREIVSAQIALRSSLAANDAAAVLKSAAQTSYDAALDSYRHGVGTVTASVEAEVQLFQARLAEDDAYTSALAAAATFAFATGQLGESPR